MTTYIVPVSAGQALGAGVLTGGADSAILRDASDASYLTFSAWPAAETPTPGLAFDAVSIPAGWRVKLIAVNNRAWNPSSPGYTQSLEVRGMFGAGPGYSSQNGSPTGSDMAPVTWTHIAWAYLDGVAITPANLANVRVVVRNGGGPGTLRLYELSLLVQIMGPPTAAVTGPVTPVTTTTAPTITWTNTLNDEAAAITSTVLRIFTAAQVAAVGFSPDTAPPVYEYTVAAAATSRTVTPLLNNTSYVAYVRIANDSNEGLQWSAWATRAFTIALPDTPPAPTVVATADDDEARIRIDVAWPGNRLTADDATLEGTVGSWTPGTGTTAARVTIGTHHAGVAHLRTTRTSAGPAVTKATLGNYAVVAGQRYGFTAMVAAPVTPGGAITPSFTWFLADGVTATGGAGVNVSTQAVAVSSAVYQLASVGATAPAGAVWCKPVLQMSRANTEYFDADSMGLWDGGDPRNVAGWRPLLSGELERSVDGGATWEAIRTPGDLGLVGSGVIAYDYEVAPGVLAQYRARAQALLAGAMVASPWGYSASVAWELDTSGAEPEAGCTAWLKDPLRPSLNLRIVVAQGSFLSQSHPARRGVFPIRGRSDPLVVSDVRLAPSSTVILTACDDDPAPAATFAALSELLADGSTLLLQTDPAWGWGSHYVSVGDVEEQRPVTSDLAHPGRLFVLPIQQVQAPGGPLAAYSGTWGDVVATYATWTTLLAAEATWGDLVGA